MKKLILAGGGHGHVNILKELVKNPIKDVQVTLISDYKRQYYSGMLSGFVENIYSEEEISFDLPRLAKKAGVDFVLDKIVEINRDEKYVKTEEDVYYFDFLSMNLGSSQNINFKIDSEDVVNTKPILNIVNAKNELVIDKIKNDAIGKILFIGAGASGIELSISFREIFKEAIIEIVTAHDILENMSETARNKIKTELMKKNIFLHDHEYVKEVKDKVVYTDKGEHQFDYLFVTSGFKGPEVKFTGFKVDDKNCVVVNKCLFADENSLAMGDQVTIDEYKNLPKAGVFAIREAPILYNNLRKLLQGKKDFINYEPQTKYLQIVNCGNKRAIMNYGNFAFKGFIPWIIKDRIDRKYMEVD